MKWFANLTVVCSLVLTSFATWAQTAGTGSAMPNPAEAQSETPVWKPNPANNKILDPIANAIGQSALQNIEEAEQVFCYQITTKPDNYTGYTLDGMAIVGFCGVINPELKTMVSSELFMNPDNVLFSQTEDCVIRPRIMLRFVRGIDSTDVLLSSPCHAFAIFYGGRVNAFNVKPAAPIIDALIDPLIKGRIDFASPALFNQLLPIGVAQTDEQKALLNKKNEPIRNWVKTQQEEEKSAKSKGWNNLNLNL